MREIRFGSKTNPRHRLVIRDFGFIPFFHLLTANENLIVMKHDHVSKSGFHCKMFIMHYVCALNLLFFTTLAFNSPTES